VQFNIYIVSFIVFLALVFDFINGFHDAANSIATVVSTRVLKPQYAVVWAAFFNFIAFLFFETKVASMVGQGLVDPHVVDPRVILAALVGAIVWGIVTWYFGIPSSSSHALVGGLMGAVITKVGVSALLWNGLSKVLISIILSPILGMFFGILLISATYWIFRKSTPRAVDGWFRKLQFLSATMVSLAHGGNDAQKTMGIIAVLLFSTGHIGPHFHVPFWVVILCQLAMGLGTLMGGWRIVKTLGSGITKLKPVGGFSAETAAATTLFLATHLGIPVSTTHTITGSIVGVGMVGSTSAVRWKVAGRIVWAWLFTIPAAGAIASLTWLIVRI
jgi:PiT family inorganic phosphate transporter